VSSLAKTDRILDLLVVYTGLHIIRTREKSFSSKGCVNKDEMKIEVGIAEGKLPMKY